MLLLRWRLLPPDLRTDGLEPPGDWKCRFQWWVLVVGMLHRGCRCIGEKDPAGEGLIPIGVPYSPLPLIGPQGAGDGGCGRRRVPQLSGRYPFLRRLSMKTRPTPTAACCPCARNISSLIASDNAKPSKSVGSTSTACTATGITSTTIAVSSHSKEKLY